MKLKCQICDVGENFECKNPYEMIEHLENHCEVLENLIDKLIKDKEKYKLPDDN